MSNTDLISQIQMDSLVLRDYDADRPDTNYADVTTIGNFFLLIRSVANLASDYNTYFPILYPDLYNELLQKYDLNGDGDITVLSNQSGDEFNADEYLAYFMFVVLDERGVDLNQSIPETLLGVRRIC